TGVIVDGAQTTYAYNAAGQLTTETTASTNTTVSYEYDEWGNQKRRLKKQGATVLSDERFGYNYRNLLSTYTNSSTGANWQYDYWPTGERYGKTNLSTSESELYIPRFGDVLSEYTKTGTAAAVLKNTYVQGLGLDSKRSRIAAGGARRHFVTNQVGTVELTLDDAGAVAEQTRRDAYGVVLGSASSERYGFAQREHDAESGLVYMRHRMYDPSTGRFTQTDPLRHRRPHAHYAYAANNPVSLVDPMGLQEHGTPLTADEVSWAKGRLYDPQNPTSLQVLGIYIEQGVFRWKHGARDLPENQARNRRNHERGHIANLDLIDEGRGDYHSYFPSLAGKYDFISGVPTFEDLKQLSFDQRFLLTANHPGLFRDQGRYQLITPAERPKISEYIQKGVAYGVGIAAAGSILEAILPEKKGLDIALGLRRVIRGGKEIRALDDFADSVGAAPAGKWKSLGLFDKEIEEKSLGFGLAFKQAATRTITGGGKIRFNLTYADIDRLKRASHTVIDEYTGWEYQQIIRHRRLWDNTVWYLDGQVVGAGKLRELGVEFIGK
ncbi:MAG TPA: RHS repeat-associated core domain-containing protein, partial [Planctomycetota bacterium]|nr:RHS repeat-associated core domain-containing protein [Planctomycetota bacterium]